MLMDNAADFLNDGTLNEILKNVQIEEHQPDTDSEE
jgi:hypothetical protein